jgi:hypothetical protein
MSEGDGGVSRGEETLDKDQPQAENADVAAGRQRETHMGFARMLATLVFLIALPVALITTNIRYSRTPRRLRLRLRPLQRRGPDRAVARRPGQYRGALAILQQRREDVYFTATSGLVPCSTRGDTAHGGRQTAFNYVNLAQGGGGLRAGVRDLVLHLGARGTACGNWRRRACSVGLGAVFLSGVDVFGVRLGGVRPFTGCVRKRLLATQPKRPPRPDVPSFWRDMTIVLGACPLSKLLIAAVAACT